MSVLNGNALGTMAPTSTLHHPSSMPTICTLKICPDSMGMHWVAWPPPRHSISTQYHADNMDIEGMSISMGMDWVPWPPPPHFSLASIIPKIWTLEICPDFMALHWVAWPPPPHSSQGTDNHFHRTSAWSDLEIQSSYEKAEGTIG